MKFSSSLEQACCVLGIVASHTGKPVTTAELNRLMQVSPSYLTKITRKLVVSELITATHGVNGGYVLAKPMHEISLLAVVLSVEGGEPFFQPTGVIERVFKRRRLLVKKSMSMLERAFFEAEKMWRTALQSTTMEQVVSGKLAKRGDV